MSCNLYARASEASQRLRNIIIGLYFLIWYGAINNSIGQNTDIEKIKIMRASAERASLENFPIFTF